MTADVELAKVEKKLDALHQREVSMDFASTTRSQRDRLRTQINELCAERNRLRGLPVRERMGDRRI